MIKVGSTSSQVLRGQVKDLLAEVVRTHNLHHPMDPVLDVQRPGKVVSGCRLAYLAQWHENFSGLETDLHSLEGILCLVVVAGGV